MRQPPPVDLSPSLARTTEFNTLLRHLAPRLGKIAGGRLDIAVISSPGPAYVTGDDATLAHLVITAVNRARERACPGAWVVVAVAPDHVGTRDSVTLSLCGSGIDPVAWNEWSDTVSGYGRVEVDVGAGMGSAAHAYFPVESRAQSPMARAGLGSPPPRTILSWCADAGARGLTHDLLDSAGFRVRSVATAAEALHELSAAPPCAISY